MKIFASYLLIVAWAGYLIMSTHGFYKENSAHSESIGCEIDRKDNTNMQCCSNLHEKGLEQKNCNEDTEGSDCCGKSDCSRTCCNIFTARIMPQTEFEFSYLPYSTAFCNFINPYLPNPFIGKFSPPPNA